jgi:hypothetical protein
MFKVVFWDILPCKIIVDRRFRGAYCLHHQGCSTYIWNVGRQFYTAVYPRRQLWTELSKSKHSLFIISEYSYISFLEETLLVCDENKIWKQWKLKCLILFLLQTCGLCVNINFWSRVSSGSIVSDYGLDCQAIGVQSPAGAKDFPSSLCVQTGSRAHPASCTMGIGGPFPGGKARPGRDADHSPLSSAEVVIE